MLANLAIECVAVNAEGFRFTIYRRGFFSDLGKLLGMQDIEVGDPEFDEAFIIKGNDEDRVRVLFSNPKIRQLIQDQPKIRLTVKDSEGWFGPKFPENVDELHFEVVGVIKDVERLKQLGTPRPANFRNARRPRPEP